MKEGNEEVLLEIVIVNQIDTEEKVDHQEVVI